MPPLSPLAAARQVTVAAQAAEGDNDAADLPRVRFVAVERKRAMPIRFRCAYCNQLMGIARRKAGTVVRCPWHNWSFHLATGEHCLDRTEKLRTYEVRMEGDQVILCL